MFRKVRKVKNEISIDAANKLLATARRGVLAVNGDDGYPYAVPINYIFCQEEGKIYFHGSGAGHKVDSIAKCDKACFTVIGNEVIKEEDWAPFVQSVVVFGRCRKISGIEQNIELVRRFAGKYFPSESLIDEEVNATGKAVQMYEIVIEYMSGKEVQER